MRRIFETAVIIMGTLGFWGFIYPELCMTDETYEAAEAENIYDFLNCRGEIRIKCRAVEYLYQVKEKMDSKKD